jgi:hypothetical protein
MTIQKKSLISTLNTTKKAIVASTPAAASPVEPTVGLSKATHNFSKKTAFSKATHNFSKKTAFSKAFSKAVR